MNAENGKPLGQWTSGDEAGSLPLSRQSLWVNSRECVDLTERLLSAIESAKKTLWVASPFIDDARIVQALKNAKARRVRIKVITDIRNNRGRGKQYLTHGFHTKSVETKNFDSHQKCIRDLARSRISCRSPTHYPHFKLIVADDEIAVMSSANLTKNSLGGNAKSSLEAGLSLVRRDQVEHLVRLLSQLWSSCPFRLILNEKDMSIEQHGSGEQIVDVAVAAAQQGLLVNSPGNGHFSLTDAVVNAVDRSKRELLFASMSFFDADSVPQLEVAVLAALARGVKVTAIIRPEHFSKQEARGEYPDPSTKRLLMSGMRLLGIPGLHAKGLLVDQAEGIIFSANINPFSLTSELESNHIEMGLQLAAADDRSIEFAAFMNDLRRSAQSQFQLA